MTDPPPEGLTEEMQQVVNEAIQNMKVEHARWAFSLGVQTQHLMVGIWDAAIEEAYACGHLHEPARDEMLARNPYRPKGDAS
jgi:hypothetical protein